MNKRSGTGEQQTRTSSVDVALDQVGVDSTDLISVGKQLAQPHSMDPLLSQLNQALTGDIQTFLGRWIAETRARCWHLATDPNLADELRDRCEPALSALAETLAYCHHLSSGAPQFKEPMKHFSFVAGWMAGVDLPVGAGLALCHGLQVALGAPEHPFFHQLAIVMGEAYVAGLREKAQARHRWIIRKSQVVCMLGNSVAALLVVGDPDGEALQDAIGRLMMIALMREARALLIDLSGAQALEWVLPRILELLSGHRVGLAARGLRIMLSGLLAERWQQVLLASPLRIEACSDIEHCLNKLDQEEVKAVSISEEK